MKKVLYSWLVGMVLLTSTALSASLEDEKFPADYFLIHKNMPHYMRIFSNYENDLELGLSSEQKKEIQALREDVVKKVVVVATKIRDLELEAKNKVVLGDKSVSEMKSLVDEIAKLRAGLTMAHIECIQKTKAVLTPKQKEFFIEKSGMKYK